jgi:hypothetical protein
VLDGGGVACLVSREVPDAVDLIEDLLSMRELLRFGLEGRGIMPARSAVG